VIAGIDAGPEVVDGSSEEAMAGATRGTLETIALMLPGNFIPQPEHHVSISHSMPMRLEAWMRITDGADQLSPVVSLHASLVLSGVQARVSFSDRANGADRTWDGVARQVLLVSPGRRLEHRETPLHGPIGRSRLTIRVVDCDQRPLTPAWDVGDCADGVRELSVPLVAGVQSSLWMALSEWSEAQGPVIRASGELCFPRGVFLRLGFRSLGGERTGRDESELQLVRPGMSLYSPARVLGSGVPGTSWLAVRFTDGGGVPIGDETLVGRCVRLGQKSRQAVVGQP